MYVLVFAFPTTALDNNSNTQKKKKDRRTQRWSAWRPVAVSKKKTATKGCLSPNWVNKRRESYTCYLSLFSLSVINLGSSLFWKKKKERERNEKWENDNEKKPGSVLPSVSSLRLVIMLEWPKLSSCFTCKLTLPKSHTHTHTQDIFSFFFSFSYTRMLPNERIRRALICLRETKTKATQKKKNK